MIKRLPHMIKHCCQLWRDKYAPEHVADKVCGDAVML
jgi:hypothetical protein